MSTRVQTESMTPSGWPVRTGQSALSTRIVADRRARVGDSREKETFWGGLNALAPGLVERTPTGQPVRRLSTPRGWTCVPREITLHSRPGTITLIRVFGSE